MRCLRNLFVYVIVLNPFVAVAAGLPVGPVEGRGGAYLGAHYNYDMYVDTGNMSGAEDVSVSSDGIHGWNFDGTSPVSYNPTYSLSPIGGGLVVGYGIGNGLRFDVTASYLKLSLDSTKYKNAGLAEYLEITRADNIFNAAGQVDHQYDQIRSITSKAKVGFKLKNTGYDVISGLLNMYYDIGYGKSPVNPYIGLGVGISRVDFLETVVYRVTFKGSAGMSVHVGSVILMCGYRYIGLWGDSHAGVSPTVAISALAPPAPPASGAPPAPASSIEKATVASTTATIKQRFGVHGGEFGIAFNF